jgi:hypothetical protein
MLIALLSLLMTSPAMAATPTESILGDWDLGPNTSALRITQRDDQSIFVQLCDHNELVNSHVCSASVILYFSFSASAGDFTHTDTGGQHLHATLQLDPSDPTVIHYDFTSDVGNGDLTGKKL